MTHNNLKNVSELRIVSVCFRLQCGKSCYSPLLGSSLPITVRQVSPFCIIIIIQDVHFAARSQRLLTSCCFLVCFFVFLFFFPQMTRLWASASAFETAKTSSRSGTKTRLSLTKPISWGKSTSSCRTYLLKQFFISVSILDFFPRSETDMSSCRKDTSSEMSWSKLLQSHFCFVLKRSYSLEHTVGTAVISSVFFIANN